MPKSQREKYRLKLRAAVNCWAEGSRYALDFAMQAHDQHPEIEEAVAGLVNMVMGAAELLDGIREKI